MSADDYLEVCRQVASYRVTAKENEEEAIEPTRKLSAVNVVNRSGRPLYTRQQIAAFKAHLTMARKSVLRSAGNARKAAIQKVARYEARLAAVLAPPEP